MADDIFEEDELDADLEDDDEEDEDALGDEDMDPIEAADLKEDKPFGMSEDEDEEPEF